MFDHDENDDQILNYKLKGNAFQSFGSIPNLQEHS